MTHVYDSRGWARGIETAAAWLLGILWVLPLVYAFWTAFHPAEFSTRFVLSAPLTLDNFAKAWAAAPFARYFLNTVILVTMVLAAQLVLVTLAAYAFARFEFRARHGGLGARLAEVAVAGDLSFRVYAAAPWPQGSRLVFESRSDWAGSFHETALRGVWWELGRRWELPASMELAASPEFGRAVLEVFKALLPVFDRVDK